MKPPSNRPLPLGRRRLAAAAASFVLAASAVPAQAEVPPVVASFKPVHSLVAALMEGVGEPALLVSGAASPHSYALTPSDARTLENARLVLWIGEDFEAFLAKAIKTLPRQAQSVALGEIDGLTRLPVREGGVWEAHEREEEPSHDHDAAEAAEHDHEHEHETAETADGGHGDAHDRDHDGIDGHLWLDPANAKLMAEAVVAALAAADPANAAAYEANGQRLRGRLDELDAEIAASLAPVRSTPFIVFHDAYQYFEQRYGLAGVGSITVNPDQPPGAKRLSEIREKIVAQQARCVFREPNFEPALVETVIADTDVRTGMLDPEGAALSEGPELYFRLMRGLADSLKTCLGASS
jgi:zinc transport system substrate-binding protein